MTRSTTPAEKTPLQETLTGARIVVERVTRMLSLAEKCIEDQEDDLYVVAAGDVVNAANRELFELLRELDEATSPAAAEAGGAR